MDRLSKIIFQPREKHVNCITFWVWGEGGGGEKKKDTFLFKLAPLLPIFCKRKIVWKKVGNPH